jgi:hypothetical protein
MDCTPSVLYLIYMYLVAYSHRIGTDSYISAAMLTPYLAFPTYSGRYSLRRTTLYAIHRELRTREALKSGARVFTSDLCQYLSLNGIMSPYLTSDVSPRRKNAMRFLSDK